MYKLEQIERAFNFHSSFITVHFVVDVFQVSSQLTFTEEQHWHDRNQNKSNRSLEDKLCSTFIEQQELQR